MNLLEVKTLDLSQIGTELAAKVEKAPGFFANSPLVLGFELLPYEQHADFDLNGLLALCKKLGLVPAATRGGDEVLAAKALTVGLATLPKGREKHVGAAIEKLPAEPDPDANIAPAQAKTKIVTTPIRSGQQVYAPGGDLIIMAAVSPGAEVLADGNIHIYGALRGRALAGVKGELSARIFCQSQEAELIAIAGHFMVDDQLREAHWQQAVQIKIDDDRVKIWPLL